MGDGLQKGGVLASRRFRFLAASCLYMGGFVLLHGPVLEVSLAFFFFVLAMGRVYTLAAMPARTYLYSVYSSVNV